LLSSSPWSDSSNNYLVIDNRVTPERNSDPWSNSLNNDNYAGLNSVVINTDLKWMAVSSASSNLCICQSPCR